MIPPDQSAIVKTLNWLDSIMFGSVLLSVAIVSVALIGFLMLAGRVDVRRSGRVIIGCFLLFGAHAIASSLLPGTKAPSLPDVSSSAPITATVPTPYPNVPPQPYDPYAGAALPNR